MPLAYEFIGGVVTLRSSPVRRSVGSAMAGAACADWRSADCCHRSRQVSRTYGCACAGPPQQFITAASHDVGQWPGALTLRPEHRNP